MTLCPAGEGASLRKRSLWSRVSLISVEICPCRAQAVIPDFEHLPHSITAMSQAIMDPDEVRRFAKELKRFNDELQVKASSLQSRFTALGDTWKDQENQKFAEEFVGTMKALKKFIEISEKHTPFLLRKAQRIEEYLDQR